MSGIEIAEGMAAGISFRRGGSGDAPPVVLLHGIGSNAASFAALMEALGPDVPTLAWNAPGYGHSQPLPVEWPDAGDYAAALAELLDALGFERCVLVGHSLGTLIAARFARLWPERLLAVALISPTLGYGGARTGPLPAKAAARLEALDRLGAAGLAAERAPGLVGDQTARPDIVAAVTAAIAAVQRPGYDQATRMLATGRLLDDVAAIRTSAAVIVGAADRITPPSTARQVAGALAQASPPPLFAEIPAAGHAVCQEEPNAVAAIIARLVAQTHEHAAEN
jgi:pimeloyl-ACP methyl ester carboxylesterase